MALTTAIIATGAVVGGTFLELEANRASARYNIDVAKANARVKQREAAFSIVRGEQDAAKLQSIGRQVKGTQRAAFASQGVDIDVGIPLDIGLETELAIEQDILTRRNNARLEAYGLMVESEGFRQQARLTRAGLGPRQTATVLGSAGNIAGVWGSYGATRPSSPDPSAN